MYINLYICIIIYKWKLDIHNIFINKSLCTVQCTVYVNHNEYAAYIIYIGHWTLYTEYNEYWLCILILFINYLIKIDQFLFCGFMEQKRNYKIDKLIVPGHTEKICFVWGFTMFVYIWM